MVGPDRRDDTTDKKTDPQVQKHVDVEARKREVLDAPSVFVASLALLLSKRDAEDAHQCAETIRRQGEMTGREFNGLVEGVSDPAFTSELLWACSFMTRGGVEADFAQGVPALITIAHRALTAPEPLDETSQKRLFRVLDRVLNARVFSDEVADYINASLSSNECLKLKNIAMQGVQDRKGYWECVELLCALFPDTSSLEYVFRGIDRLGGSPPQKADRIGAGRSISAVASADFAVAFAFVAQALGAEDRPESSALRRAAVTGLAFHADRAAEPLARFVASQSESEALLACQVCVRADRESAVSLSQEQRDCLAEELRFLVSLEQCRSITSHLHDEALSALSCITTAARDMEVIGAHIRARLSNGGTVTSALATAYAEGLSRIEGEEGIGCFTPLSEKKFRLLKSNPPLVNRLSRQDRLVVEPDTENVFERLAVDIASASRFDDVLELCGEHAQYVDLRSLKGRDNDSLSLFYDVKDAVRFSQFHAELAEKGPVEFSVVLLPELLSAVDEGRDSDDESSGEAIGENALRSLASVTSVIVDDPTARELAVSRLSPADWRLLSSFHKMNIRDYPRVYPDLALVVFALRAVLEESDGKWQHDLLSWWGKVDDEAREEMDPNALAFVSVIAERCRAGAVWDLMSQLSLSTGEEVAFRDIASGLLVNTDRAVRKVCDLVQSPRGDELARAFLISQLMSRYVSDQQRESILGVARRSIDEIGILALDAVGTIGALSSSLDDAAMLLQAQPCLGLKESLYRVSCARAAARVLRNRERRSRT